MSDWPDSTSATRLAPSATNLKTTVSKAGLPPQYFGLALRRRNAFLRLKANPKYWGGKPAFDTVVFKFVADGASRVAEVESGQSDITLEIPYEEFDRLKGKGFTGYATPISDIGMIFINNIPPMLDRNVRLAANWSIDKKSIVDKLLRGYGIPISTLEAPGYEAYDPSIKI